MQRVSAAAPPVRERQQAARAACLVSVVAVGLMATVALVRGGAGAESVAQRASWEHKSSRGIDFWHIRAYGQNGVPRSMAGQGRHVGLHQQSLQVAGQSEDEPPFLGKDIGRTSGQGSTGNFEPMETDDYGLYGPAMTFKEHDAVMRRLRDMVDDDGAPKDSNDYVTSAKDKSFLDPLLKVDVSTLGKLDYDPGQKAAP